jgi:hypothetical protein
MSKSLRRQAKHLFGPCRNPRKDGEQAEEGQCQVERPVCCRRGCDICRTTIRRNVLLPHNENVQCLVPLGQRLAASCAVGAELLACVPDPRSTRNRQMHGLCSPTQALAAPPERKGGCSPTPPLWGCLSAASGRCRCPGDAAAACWAAGGTAGSCTRHPPSGFPACTAPSPARPRDRGPAPAPALPKERWGSLRWHRGAGTHQKPGCRGGSRRGRCKA